MSRRVLLLADCAAVGMLYTLWSARPLWSDLALTVLLAIVVIVTWKPGTIDPRHLSLPALAFLAAWVLAALFAPQQLVAWRSVLGLVAYGLVWLLLGNLLAHGVTRSELYRALLLAAQVVTVPLALVWLADGARLWGYRVRFETNNSAALAVLMLMPALIVGERRALVVGESGVLLWLSASRSGALGLAGAVGATVLRGRAGQRWWPLLVIVGLVLGVGLAARGDLLAVNERGRLWGVAARMAAASPLVGQGPNSYKGWWLAADDSAYFFGHAHNLALNLLAETGVLGLAAGAWLAGALLLALARRGSSPWAVAALAATVGLLAHSVGDVPTTQPYITVAWLALVRMGLE